MELFGSSGIRGVVNDEITPGFGIALGSAVGSGYRRVVIGYDTRTSNIMVSSAIVAGLLSTGAEVHNAGMVATPTLARAAKKFDCGIMVTASHNPAEYNGVKLWNLSGMAFTDEQATDIERLLKSRKFTKARWYEINNSHVYENAVREHIDSIRDGIGHLNLKVVIDCGSGAASNITPYLFRELGCSVFTLNCHPDGHFPGRDPEPSEENLGALMNAVVHHKADLGIAHDGDADRMAAVDEKGDYAGGDRLLALFTKYEAKKRIVVPVDASMALEEYGKEVIRTKVGDVFIAQEMMKHRADFGGEPSGTWIFPEVTYCPDGIYAAARLAKMVEEKGNLSQLVKGLKTYPIVRGKLDYDKKKKAGIKKSVEKALSAIKAIETSKIDGTRLKFKDSWALVRFSGTEPKIRITAEAKTRKEAGLVYSKIQRIVAGCI